MPYPAETVTTTGAFLLVLALVVPVVGVLLAFVGGRHAERVALATLPLGLFVLSFTTFLEAALVFGFPLAVAVLAFFFAIFVFPLCLPVSPRTRASGLRSLA